VRLPAKLCDALEDQAEKADRSINYVIVQAIKEHVYKVTPDVGKVVSGWCQGDTTVVLPSPGPARAPASDPIRDRDLDPSHAEDGPEQTISELITSLRWYGAKLAKDTTPDEFASNLLEAFPGADIGAELHKASAWLAQSPKRRKKYLGSFLLGWMGRIGKEPGYKPKQSTVKKQAGQQDFIDGEW